MRNNLSTDCRKGLGAAAIGVALVSVGALAPVDSARAGIEAAFWERGSRVDSTVQQIGNEVAYDFTVFNTSTPSPCEREGDSEEILQIELPQCNGTPFIVDWELPLFSEDDIDMASITSPTGWAYEIIQNPTSGVSTPFFNNPAAPFGQYDWNYDASSDPLLVDPVLGDPDLYGPNPEVFENPPLIIHWYLAASTFAGAGIAPSTVGLGGFGFTSAYGSLNAPYLSSWAFEPPITGDPPIPGNAFGTPLSPTRANAQGIPAPGVAALMMAGIAVLIGARRRKARVA